MKLHNIARRFDKTVAVDAYNPATSFRCQLSPVALYKVDATAIRRREMSTAPDVVIPPRKTIQINNDVFLVGEDSPDQWNGSEIRNNYVLQGADFLANIYSLQQALANTAPSTAWCSLDFNKNMSDERQGSEYLSQYNIFFAGGEVVPTNSLINNGSRWFLVRQSYTSVSGLVVTLSNEIENPAFETVTFSTISYDPVTDMKVPVSNSVRALRIRWTEWFQYLSAASVQFERGDMRLFVLKTDVTAEAGDEITMSDGVWCVLSVLDEGAAWNCHVRRK